MNKHTCKKEAELLMNYGSLVQGGGGGEPENKASITRVGGGGT